MIEKLEELLNNRILVLDGAMGTMIQNHNLTEADFRGTRYADHGCDVKGNNDLLNLTKPEIIQAIHTAYLEAGSDIITTNTFNANAISQADYHLQDFAYEMNLEAARNARKAIEQSTIQWNWQCQCLVQWQAIEQSTIAR